MNCISNAYDKLRARVQVEGGGGAGHTGGTPYIWSEQDFMKITEHRISVLDPTPPSVSGSPGRFPPRFVSSWIRFLLLRETKPGMVERRIRDLGSKIVFGFSAVVSRATDFRYWCLDVKRQFGQAFRGVGQGVDRAFLFILCPEMSLYESELRRLDRLARLLPPYTAVLPDCNKGNVYTYLYIHYMSIV